MRHEGTFHIDRPFGFRVCCISPASACITLLCRWDDGFLLIKTCIFRGFDVAIMSMEGVEKELFWIKTYPKQWDYPNLHLTVKNVRRDCWPKSTFIQLNLTLFGKSLGIPRSSISGRISSQLAASYFLLVLTAMRNSVGCNDIFPLKIHILCVCWCDSYLTQEIFEILAPSFMISYS